MASKRKQLGNEKRSFKRSSSPRLTIRLSPQLKRRIKVAAAAREIPVSTYVVLALENALPSDDIARVVGRKVTQEMIDRADALRKRQKAPFLVDSVDLIREARLERDGQY